MKENEIDNLKNMEKHNTNSMNENNEKVHYEIKFVETEDGYRLEASGDKAALKRLGIGPNMVGRGRRRGPGRGRGTQGRRREPRWAGRGPAMHRGPGRRAGVRAQRRWAMQQRQRFAESEQPGYDAGFGWDW